MLAPHERPSLRLRLQVYWGAVVTILALFALAEKL